MHDVRRPALESCEAALERLQSPRLGRVRVAEQDRIVELNDPAAGLDQRRDFMTDGVGVVERKPLPIAP